MSVAQTRSDCVALLGFGNVGLGWAASYLAKGFEVRAFDPQSGLRHRADKFLRATWPSLQALGFLINRGRRKIGCLPSALGLA